MFPVVTPRAKTIRRQHAKDAQASMLRSAVHDHRDACSTAAWSTAFFAAVPSNDHCSRCLIFVAAAPARRRRHASCDVLRRMRAARRGATFRFLHTVFFSFVDFRFHYFRHTPPPSFFELCRFSFALAVLSCRYFIFFAFIFAS
jgi:hypothetical protein